MGLGCSEKIYSAAVLYYYHHLERAWVPCIFASRVSVVRYEECSCSFSCIVITLRQENDRSSSASLPRWTPPWLPPAAMSSPSSLSTLPTHWLGARSGTSRRGTLMRTKVKRARLSCLWSCQWPEWSLPFPTAPFRIHACRSCPKRREANTKEPKSTQ